MVVALAVSGVVGSDAPVAWAASITVTTTADISADDGSCSLREAITAANDDAVSGGVPGECPAGSGSDTIVLPTSANFVLASALAILDSEITIDGRGSTIDADGTGRVLDVGGSGDLTIDNLTLTHLIIDITGHN